jgi:hypothetical protein
LQVAAIRSGLRCFDIAVLERHKAAALQEHPPGWIYRHRNVLQPVLGLTLIASFLGLVLLEAQNHGVAAAVLAVTLFAVISVALLKPMRGPARWEERPDPDLGAIHPRIADSAHRLRAQLPDVRFRIGELFQEKVQLDPYLVATYRGEQLLLGIWEGERVILCA